MWKKLTLIRILVANGVPMVSQLFEEYKAARRDYVQRHHEVGFLSSELIDGNSRLQIAKNANNWALDVFRQVSKDYDSATLYLTEK